MMSSFKLSSEHTENVTRYFDSLSMSWESKYASNGSMRSRLRRFADELSRKKVYAPASILDFGCGPGDLSWHLASLGYRLCGVDQSKEMVDRARNRFKSENLEFCHYSASAAPKPRLPFVDGQFQVCIASSVLEYVSPLENSLAELRRVVATRGLLVMTVPNLLHPLRLIESVEIGMFKSSTFGNFWSKSRLDYLQTSVNRLSVAQWRDVLRREGWRVETTRGWLDSLVMLCAEAD